MNKIKIWLIAFVSLIVTQTAISQTYEKMLDTTKQWNVLHSLYSNGIKYSTEQIKVIEETRINGELCQVIGSSDTLDLNYIPIMTLYEDSTGAVYRVVPDNGLNNPILMYNFNLNEGDSVTVYSQWWYVQVENTFEVLKVDTVFFAEKFRKRISLGYMGTTDTTEYWYEGIGSSFGLIYSGYFLENLHYDLLCYYENDSLLYNYNILGDYSCWIHTLTPIIPITDNEFFSPNPASDNIYLKENSGIERCIIYDMNGKAMLSTNNVNSIDVSKLKQGIYVIHLLTKSQNYIQKLLICRD